MELGGEYKLEKSKNEMCLEGENILRKKKSQAVRGLQKKTKLKENNWLINQPII